jgi:choline monooxygenase
VDPDIRRAEPPPARWYADPAVHRRVQERVFARSWQLVLAADTSRLRSPGAALPFSLLDGCLDEPLLLTRAGDDRLRCLSNVCTHRGSLLVEGETHLPAQGTLRCRYHGRRFGLDGRLVAAPGFEDAADFPSPADDLPPAALERWGPFLFVGLDPAVAFERSVGPMRSRLERLPLASLEREPAGARDYLVRANWALYVENYLEGYHIPYVHEGLARALDVGAYRTELFPHSVLQLGIAGSGEEGFDAIPAGAPDQGQRVAAFYCWLFPNTMINVYPWGVSVNVVVPLAVDRTRVSYLTYVWDAARRGRGAGADLDRVERQDEDVVEAVQRGIGARLYRSGRYAPRHERGVHHFHRLLAEWLGEAG